MRKIFCFMAAVMVMTGCATQSDFRQLDGRIAGLEKQNRQLKESLASLQSQAAGQKDQRNDLREVVASVDAQFYDLKSDVRKIRGSVEESQFEMREKIQALQQQLQQAKASIDKNIQSIAFHDTRLTRLESFMGMESTDKFKARAESQYPDKKELKDLTEEQLYDVAKQMFDDGEHDPALQGFQIFLKKYEDSEKADNARFWIGEIYFEEKWYEKAILEYEKVINEYPEGNKVPAAYLKQGISFHKLGENANARLILKELIQKYPDSNEAKIAKRQIAKIE
ncbi:MAG: tol-pal system protein YbgF [Thermodesulfobacteriota bacterium]